jgi:predicted nucleotidyltransferase
MKVTSAFKDELISVLFGKARRSILALLFTHTDEQFYLRRIVRETGIGLGPAQRELSQLSRAGIIIREVRDRLVYYQANIDCPIYDELRNIVIKTAGIADVIHYALGPVSSGIDSAFVYGSFAEGSENSHSDVDLMVIGRVKFADISNAVSPAQEKLRREINIAAFSLHEFRQRLNNGDHFITSIMNGPRVFVTGNEDELKKLVK